MNFKFNTSPLNLIYHIQFLINNIKKNPDMSKTSVPINPDHYIPKLTSYFLKQIICPDLYPDLPGSDVTPVHTCAEVLVA